MNKTKNTFDSLDLNLDFNLNLDLEINQSDEISEPLKNPQKELTDEIKNFRQKNKEFQATNDHETYLIICFSCKDDKKEFLKNTGLEGEHTLIDGYEMARKMKIKPEKPRFKLREPLCK